MALFFYLKCTNVSRDSEMGRSGDSLTAMNSLAVLLSLCLISYCYWDNPKQLLKYGFFLFLVFALLVAVRHIWFRMSGPLKASFADRKEESGEDKYRPELDREKNEAREKAQKLHNERADDFEQRVAAPRREQKLQQLEKKMKSIRGFHGEGSVVGSCSEGTTGGGSSRLMGEHDEVIRRRNVEQSREGARSHVIGTNQSDSESEEENEEGRLITIALKLPSKSVHKQFRTSYKIKSVYKWLQSLGYSPRFYCLATTLPRQLLLDTQETLEHCGLSRDTVLALEEREN